MTASPRLSVLDLIPVRSGQTSADAVAASVALAQAADRLDYARYWFAEHHNMPAVASTTPPDPTRIRSVRAATAAMSTGGVVEATAGMLWCAANQYLA